MTNTTAPTDTTTSRSHHHHTNTERTDDRLHPPLVTNPPSIFVKLQNIISKPELNQQYGLVVQYDSSKQRYQIVLCRPLPSSEEEEASVRMVSMKYENLIRCTSFYDRSMAQYQMIRYHPSLLQSQIQQVHVYLVQQFLVPLFRICHIPPSILLPKIQYVYVILVVVVYGIWYFIGMTKLLLVLTLILILLSLIGKDLLPQQQQHPPPPPTSLRTIFFQRLPMHYTKMIETELPYHFGRILTQKPIYLRSFTTLLFLFVIYTLFGTPTQSRYWTSSKQHHSGSNQNPNRSSSSSSTNSVSSYLSSMWSRNPSTTSTPPFRQTTIHNNNNDDQLQYYYHLGFQDATQQLPHGTSIWPLLHHHHDSSRSSSQSAVILNEDGTTTTTTPLQSPMNERNENDPVSSSSSSSSTTSSWHQYDHDPRIYHSDMDDIDTAVTTRRTYTQKPSPFSISTMMAVFTLYRILQPIVTMSCDTSHHIDWSLLRTNFYTQMKTSPWNMIIVTFALYRIVVAFL